MRSPAVILATLLLPATSAQAARPLITNDPEPVPQGHFQVENAITYARESGEHRINLPLTLTYGVVENLELSAASGWQWERLNQPDDSQWINSVGDVILAGKWKFLTQEKAFADQALSFSLLLPAADNDLGTGHTVADLTWILSRQITEKFAVLFNLGYTYHDAGSDKARVGLAGQYQLTPALQPAFEVVTEVSVDDPNSTRVILNGGIRWQAAKNLVFDAAIGTEVREHSPDLFIQFGFTWVI